MHLAKNRFDKLAEEESSHGRGSVAFIIATNAQPDSSLPPGSAANWHNHGRTVALIPDFGLGSVRMISSSVLLRVIARSTRTSIGAVQAYSVTFRVLANDSPKHTLVNSAKQIFMNESGKGVPIAIGDLPAGNYLVQRSDVRNDAFSLTHSHSVLKSFELEYFRGAK